ncbi:MAG: C40 family peptidase [Deltaproteobacteria bacterium]|nr:C40 family peptidase [Deltaproteobacteria bacterium]
MGYTIQVGAFAQVENAARLASRLNSDNLDAYYFLYKRGLYKVRFGNFPTRELAAREAEILKGMGVIGEYYIVRPEEYAVTKRLPFDEPLFRDEIVRTARSFIGVPYQWGGISAEEGFDCSGLAMAIYRLNGLNLPRTSGQQYGAGMSVSREELAKGDLVFFDTRGRGDISHVGIYVGEDRFIHAPRTGKTVRTSSLLDAYYQKRYIGARTYL